MEFRRVEPPQTQRKKLRKHRHRIRHFGRPGGGRVLGVIFVLVGTIVMLMGAGVIPMGGGDSDEGSRRMALVFGGMFAMAGLVAFFASQKAVKRHDRSKEMLARHPNEPWLADYEWDSRGIDDGRRRQIRKSFLWAAFAVVWLAPFHWIGLTGATVALVFMALFDVAILLLIGHAVYLLLQQRKYGTSRVEFDRFPYHPGETLDVGFTNPSIGAFRALRITLRHVEDEVKIRGTSKNRRYEVTSYQLYADTVETTGPGELNRAACPVALSLPLPAEDYTTRLSGRSPRYWELEVHADKLGVDYRAVFLLPVYARLEQT